MKSGAGKRDQYNRMIGSIPCLEEWTTELPGIKLVVPQPYSYSRNTRVGFRTLQSSMNTISHHYKIRTKITDILRMRVKLERSDEPILTFVGRVSMDKGCDCLLKACKIIASQGNSFKW